MTALLQLTAPLSLDYECASCFTIALLLTPDKHDVKSLVCIFGKTGIFLVDVNLVK